MKPVGRCCAGVMKIEGFKWNAHLPVVKVTRLELHYLPIVKENVATLSERPSAVVPLTLIR